MVQLFIESPCQSCSVTCHMGSHNIMCCLALVVPWHVVVVVWDLVFFICFGKPVGACLQPVWLRGGCAVHVAGLLIGWTACWVVSCGDYEILWWTLQYRDVVV